MPDINKIIKAWECCTDEVGVDNCDKCPYNNDFNGCLLYLKKDTIELLKFYKEHEHEVCANCPIQEQDEIVPYIDIDEAKCPNCKVKLTRQELLGEDVLFEDFYDYCPRCGKKVKWDA